MICKIFKIKSPSGKNHSVMAETIFHAVQKLMLIDNFQYKTNQYLKNK